MSEKAAPRSILGDLPTPKTIRELQIVLPGSAERIMAQWEEQARYVRRIGIRRLHYAMGLMVLAILATIVLALLDKAWPAVATSSSGAVTVATTLITGRSPELARRRRST